MKIKPLLWVQGVLYAVFGLMFAAVPEMAMGLFVGELGVTVSFYVLTRMFGATSLGLAVLLLGAVKIQEVYTKRLLAIALVVILALGAFLHGYGVMVGAILPVGWSMVILDAILAILFATTLLRSDP